MSFGIAVKPDIPRPAPRSSAPPASAGFAARLDGATLADLIQMECMRGTRHVIRVTSENRFGYLFFDRGQVVHAATGERVGESAALWMLGWKNGTFESTDQPWPLRTSIQTSWQSLVMRAAQHEDESIRDSQPDSSEVISTAAFLGHDEEVTVVASGWGEGAGANDTVREIAVKEEPVPSATASEEHEGVLRAVRLDAEGNMLSHIGAVGDFADVSSYAVRLCSLIGEALGLEEFVGIECSSDEKTFLSFWDDDTIVALEARSNADVDAYRKRAGI